MPFDLCRALRSALVEGALSPSLFRLVLHSDVFNGAMIPRSADDLLDREARHLIWNDLVRAVESGTYKPTPAHSISVPKAGGQSKQASFLTIHDLLVFEALVRRLVPTIERGLAGPDVLYGPRARSTVRRWSSFEHSVVRFAPRFVLLADVADCYATLSHATIEDRLQQLGCPPHFVMPTMAFLEAVVGAPCGVPILPRASDILATAVLGALDETMVAAGWSYTRCVDDVRVALDRDVDAAAALSAIAEGLEDLGLRIHAAKTRIVSIAEYRAPLGAGARWQRLTWDRLAVMSDGRPRIARALHSLRRAFLRVRATPKRTEHYVADLRAANELGTHSSMPDPDARRLVARAIDELAVSRPLAIVEVLGPLLLNFPELTAAVASHLRTMLRTPARRRAIAEVETVLATGALEYPVQLAWLYWAMQPVGTELPNGIRQAAVRSLQATDVDRVCRVEAARLLGVVD